MENLVSVIIPIYGVENYLEDCIDSVRRQTYENLEIILVDDGSPDNCGKICDGYATVDARVKVIHKSNGGVSSARNAGIKSARGEWICFIDPDDWIKSDMIEKALGFAAKNNCDMCMFDYDEIYTNKKVNRCVLEYQGNIFTDLSKSELFFAYMCKGNVWSMITKTSIISQIEFNESISYGEDELFRLKMYKKIKAFSYIREPLYNYRRRLGSAMTSLSFYEKINNIVAKYQMEMNVINSTDYPQNAAKIIHSKYLENFWDVCRAIFDQKASMKRKREFYNKYINSREFKESIEDFSDMYFKKITSVCLKRKRAPNWLFVCFLITLRDVKHIFVRKSKYVLVNSSMQRKTF